MQSMETQAPRRIPVWAILLSGFLIGIPGSLLFIPWLETRRWADMRRWCEDVAREVNARDSRRPVLRGVVVQGNAWDEYRRALHWLGPVSQDLPNVVEFLNRRSSGDRSKARAFVERHVPALEALRRGASRSHARLYTDCADRSETLGSYPNYLALLAACQARFLEEEGRPQEAMELLLDTAQFAEDGALNGTILDAWSAIGFLSTVLDELKECVSRERMTAEAYREMSRELELLDQGFPREAQGYSIEPMRAGFYFLQKESLPAVQEAYGISDPARATWRYGFSERLVLLDAFQSEREWGTRLKQAAELPWKEAREIQKQVDAEWKATQNPLLKKIGRWFEEGPMNPHPRSIFRERRAQLRLLRSAAAYRARGEVTVLDDPFGGKIHSLISGNRLKVWSVGGDGIDDGGAGDWNPKKGKDIVFEVER